LAVLADVKKDGGVVQDPFLERLLTAGSASAKKVHKLQKEIADGATDLEQRLAGRCNATKRALVGLLDVIDAKKHLPDDDAAPSSTASDETAELREKVIVSTFSGLTVRLSLSLSWERREGGMLVTLV
jgi:hypothetical protein